MDTLQFFSPCHKGIRMLKYTQAQRVTGQIYGRKKKEKKNLSTTKKYKDAFLTQNYLRGRLQLRVGTDMLAKSFSLLALPVSTFLLTSIMASHALY